MQRKVCFNKDDAQLFGASVYGGFAAMPPMRNGLYFRGLGQWQDCAGRDGVRRQIAQRAFACRNDIKRNVYPQLTKKSPRTTLRCKKAKILI
jgi:hypothetical protein